MPTNAITAQSSATTRLEDGLDGAEQDHQIQPGVEVTQVIKVIGKLEIGIFDAAGIRRTDLSPTTQARTHPVALAIVRDAPLKFMLKLRALRPARAWTRLLRTA